MQVTVKLFATFQSGRFDVRSLELTPGTTLAALAETLGIAPREIGVLLVGGRHAELDHVPSAGDTIAIYPLLGGG
jgi:molybdopterin synthase sulfur carrier subunit